MRVLGRRWSSALSIAACLIISYYLFDKWFPLTLNPGSKASSPPTDTGSLPEPTSSPTEQRFRWDEVPHRYPVTSVIPLPTGKPVKIPRIQHQFRADDTSREGDLIRKTRLRAVQETLEHVWEGYRQHAWLKDEVSPISKGNRNTFGGWAATLVDTLDTLWIMGLHKEFDEAVSAIVDINFTKSSEDEINVFETTIRYLGGFLSAYDLSGNSVLLHKAIELGEMLYVAFDTPNRMPITRWKWESAAQGQSQEAHEWVLLAEIGSLSLEFTRLSQLSKDPKYFDAIQRISDQLDLQQNLTKLPGMWPLSVNARDLSFVGDNTFSIGAMSDSTYEYLPKQYMMLGGLENQYRKMYEDSIDVVKKKLMIRPLNQHNLDVLLPVNGRTNDGSFDLDPQGQHLVCFAGGMVGIGAKIFERDELDLARKLVDGCIWAYEAMPTGIMPETFHMIPSAMGHEWNETEWHEGILRRQGDSQGGSQGVAQEYISSKRLQPGFTDIGDRRYILRPEAIESIFILYRITGDTSLQDKAWRMFEAIEKYTRTEIANAALDDVTTEDAPKSDRMESFWTAETLKYFYLIFSTPDVISLDEYVFNTEAHPLKRPQQHGFWNW